MAIPLMPPLCAVATSSTVSNSQTETGDTSSNGSLTINSVTNSASATTSAAGNALSGGIDSGQLDVESVQTLGGNYSAPTLGSCTTNVCSVTHAYISAGNISGPVVMTTASTGNEVSGTNNGALALTGNFSQSAGAVLITSETDFNAGNASLASVSASSQAIVNSVSFGLSGNASTTTTANFTAIQNSAATVDAETGSEPASGAQLQTTPGTAAFSTIAVANNVGDTGVGVAGQTINVTQTTTGNLTQAAGFVNIGTAQTVQGDATATANNISAINQGGPLTVTSDQTNSSFVFGDSVVTANQFGTGEATANGVGNSVIAGNAGPSTTLDNVQVNTGGIESSASFTATGGAIAYDASASATAMGNSATGYACSSCSGTINVVNNQTNSGGVDSFASATVNGPIKSSANVVSTAVGNNATFYVSKPGG